MTLSIVSNLSLLGFFKYFNFAADNFDAITSWLGLPELQIQRVVTVVLPLGISFYTFQSMSYTIDVYRGHAQALGNFIDFACYVSMFPQLVAGPIIRFSQVADQFAERTHTVTKFARGVAFISLGLAKKILLANPCGKVADVVFEAGSIGVVDAWYGVIAYAFQIYFDFSAYSDMAIGLVVTSGASGPAAAGRLLVGCRATARLADRLVEPIAHRRDRAVRGRCGGCIAPWTPAQAANAIPAGQPRRG